MDIEMICRGADVFGGRMGVINEGNAYRCHALHGRTIGPSHVSPKNGVGVSIGTNRLRTVDEISEDKPADPRWIRGQRDIFGDTRAWTQWISATGKINA